MASEALNGEPEESDGAVKQASFQSPVARSTTPNRIEVRTTASSGGSIYVNKGRSAGLEAGDQVLLYPARGGIVSATVESVSTDSSRCSLPMGAPSIDIGTRGEALVPADRLDRDEGVGGPDRASRRQAPEHPPWTRRPEEWDDDRPLLAGTPASDAGGRPTEAHGNVYAQYVHTWDQAFSDRQYSLGRVGTRLRVDNPLHLDDQLRFEGEFYRREFRADDGDGELLGRDRLSRLSYRWGGMTETPLRIELGRFLQSEFPELGILDGTEIVYRVESGSRVGFSVGFLPEPFLDWQPSDDFQVAAFYRYVYGEDETFRAGIAYQKTWHEGSPDRDLLVGSMDYIPNDRFSLRGTFWGDIYGSQDTLEQTSFEITQALLQGVYQVSSGGGIGAHFTQLRWPEVLRDQTLSLLESQIQADQIQRDFTLRYGLFAWQEFGPHVRLDGSLDGWSDQDQRSGTTFDFRLAFRDLLYPQGEVGVGVYNAAGIYSSGLGGRAFLTSYTSWGFVSLSYDATGFEFNTDASQSLQHALNASVDFNLSASKTLSLFGDCRFGQGQNSLSTGLFFQHLF